MSLKLWDASSCLEFTRKQQPRLINLELQPKGCALLANRRVDRLRLQPALQLRDAPVLEHENISDANPQCTEADIERADVAAVSRDADPNSAKREDPDGNYKDCRSHKHLVYL
jgi:hypothetical protein